MRAFPLVAAALAAFALVAGCVETPATTADLQSPLSGYTVPVEPKVDAVALLADHAKFVADNPVRKGDAPTHEQARADLTALFASYGLEVYRHDFSEGGLDQANIVGIKWGAVRDQWVIVGGHYDTTTNGGANTEGVSQGAYDDGSGTFITVHLAKAFSQVQPYYTMAFIGYDGEERGLQGAQAFVQDVVVAGESPYGAITVVGTVDLDMIGINWPGTMAPVTLMTNSQALGATADAKRTEMGWPDDQWHLKPNLNEAGLVALGTSDFHAYMQQGIPTIFFISDFIEMGAPLPSAVPDVPQAGIPVGVYPFWHQVDTVDTMRAMAGGQDNLEAGFQSISDVVTHILFQLACHPELEWDGEVSDA